MCDILYYFFLFSYVDKESASLSKSENYRQQHAYSRCVAYYSEEHATGILRWRR